MVIGISVDVLDYKMTGQLSERYNDILGHIQIYLDDSPYSTIRKEISRYLDEDMSYSFHAKGDIGVSNPSHYDDAIKTIDLASSLEVAFINFHCGGFCPDKESRSSALSRLTEQAEKLCVYAHQYNIEIHLENDICSQQAPNQLGTSLEDWEIIRRIKQPNFRMCYDIGHANISFGSKHIHQQFIASIGSIHLHNNDGKTDLHLPLGGMGEVNLLEILEQLQYSDKVVILENGFEDHAKALAYLDNWLKAIKI